jgi:hypothetical protein
MLWIAMEPSSVTGFAFPIPSMIMILRFMNQVLDWYLDCVGHLTLPQLQTEIDFNSGHFAGSPNNPVMKGSQDIDTSLNPPGKISIRKLVERG